MSSGRTIVSTLKGPERRSASWVRATEIKWTTSIRVYLTVSHASATFTVDIAKSLRNVFASAFDPFHLMSEAQKCILFFFNACILRYYLSKLLTSLSCSLNAVFPGLKMWDTFACNTTKKLIHFIISIAVLENVPPDAGLQKRATFSTLNVGLTGTGYQTLATCVASSGTNRSAIHYALRNVSFGA
jgi:hypothetical protein